MARLPARSLLVTAAALALAGGCTAPVAAQGPAPRAPAAAPSAPAAAPVATPPPSLPPPPAPSRLWPFRRLYHIDYVDVREIARHYGLRAAWATRGQSMHLLDAGGRVRLRFTDRDRDFFLDGVRVFMGEPAVADRDSLWVSRIDVIKTIAPLVRPAEYASLLPAPPRLIVLDPGHGGSDPGKQNFALHLDEKAMTLDVVLRLRTLLETRGYRVLLTRSDDSKLAPAQRADLEQRAEVANRAHADLFLSIHFNSAQPGVRGTETYVLTPQFLRSSADERRDDSADRALPGNRQDMANAVLGYQLHRTVLAKLQTSDRGCKRGRLLVLCFAECPAALVEAAYLSNDTEARQIATPEYRQRIAAAIADGVDAYAAALAALRRPAP